MSDDILKRIPNDNLDAELDKNARDIVDKESWYFYKTDPFGDHVKTYDTIEDWLDDKTIEIQLNTARLKECGLDFGLYRSAEIKNDI